MVLGISIGVNNCAVDDEGVPIPAAKMKVKELRAELEVRAPYCLVPSCVPVDLHMSTVPCRLCFTSRASPFPRPRGLHAELQVHPVVFVVFCFFVNPLSVANFLIYPVATIGRESVPGQDEELRAELQVQSHGA